MQLYNTKIVCPLCRKSVEDGPSRTLPTTRLCQNCRSLVHAIVPDKNGSSASPEIKYFTPVAHTEVEAHTRYDEQDYLDADGLDDFGANHYADSYNQTRGIDQSASQGSMSEQNGNQPQTSWQPSRQARAEWGSHQQEDRWATPPAQTTGLAEPQRWHQTLVQAPAPTEDEIIQPEQPIYQEDVTPTVYHEEGAQPVYQTEPVHSHDPWENPLPAGETSLNEWPILVQTNKRKSATKLKAVLGVVVIAALSAAGYFFAYKPFFANQPAAGQTAAAINPPAPPPIDTASPSSKPSTPSDSAQPSATMPSATTPSSAVAPATTPTGDKQNMTPAPTDPTSGEGAFSLQAMSSSSHDEANKFSEKLMRAGVSAYVVQADIPGRGRWYRVRIGRFGTREEAMKYGEQSKMRAKAAGVKLDLIVSPYEKP